MTLADMEPIASTNAIVVTMEVLVNLNQVIIPEEQEVDLGHYYIQHLRIFCTKLSRSSIKWECFTFFRGISKVYQGVQSRNQ